VASARLEIESNSKWRHCLCGHIKATTAIKSNVANERGLIRLSDICMHQKLINHFICWLKTNKITMNKNNHYESTGHKRRWASTYECPEYKTKIKIKLSKTILHLVRSNTARHRLQDWTVGDITMDYGVCDWIPNTDDTLKNVHPWRRDIGVKLIETIDFWPDGT